MRGCALKRIKVVNKKCGAMKMKFTRDKWIKAVAKNHHCAIRRVRCVLLPLLASGFLGACGGGGGGGNDNPTPGRSATPAPTPPWLPVTRTEIPWIINGH
ncbi:hypothetical protein P886_4305 [Alteromonadaceae bacterium 2753L.S.0a.02]|nr:hypothetical protein P886_4305 [Alteromonadaceae bacterium 2753L.S.0a.02]